MFLIKLFIHKIIHSLNYINVSNNYNEQFGDPLYNISKKLYLTFLIKNDKQEQIKKLVVNENTYIMFQTTYAVNALTRKNNFFCLVGTYPNFNLYFNCIKFDKKFYDIVDSLNLTMMNVIHFRYENDWISFVSQNEENNKENIKEKILKSYLNVLHYLEEDKKVCVLTADSNSIYKLNIDKSKIYHLTTEEKDILLLDKFGITGREMRGILDFIIGVKYAKVFIGYFDIETNKGSTFSYALSMSNKATKNILIYDE